MKKNRRVFVRNIPITGVVQGYVMIPRGTPHEELHDAIAEALRDSGYEPVNAPPLHPTEIEVDEKSLDKWGFETPFMGDDD